MIPQILSKNSNNIDLDTVVLQNLVKWAVSLNVIMWEDGPVMEWGIDSQSETRT